MEMQTLFTTYKLNHILNIMPFSSANKPIAINKDDQSRTLFTTLENVLGGLDGHQLVENSPLNKVVNGIYYLRLNLSDEKFCYLGKAASERCVGDRVCHHIHRLRGLPLRQDIIKIIQKKPKFRDLSKHQARVLFRSLVFKNYSDLGDFFDVPGDINPFSKLSKRIRLDVSSFEEQKKFFYENLSLGLCEIDTGANVSELHAVLISLLEIFFLQTFKEETGSIPTLNSIMPREKKLINQLKNWDQTEIETTLADYPTPFYHFINRKIKED